MAAGFQVINENGIIQIDQDYLNSRLVATGTINTLEVGSGPGVYAGSFALTGDIAANLECPMVLVRPSQADKYVGGVNIFPSGINMRGQCPFDYAIFSSRGTPVSDGSSAGLEVYDASGAVVFSSRHQTLRLLQSFNRPANAAWPVTFGLTSNGAMPWLWAVSMIVVTGGSATETVPCVCAKVSPDLTLMTANVLDGVTMNPSSAPIINATSQYFGIGAFS